MIAVSGLCATFGEFSLQRIQFAVGEGDYWVILGPSGCGKSVFLQTLAGFYRPQSGTIRMGKTDLTPLPPEQRNMGLVFQQASLFPHQTVRENIGYALKVRRKSADEIRNAVDEMIARFSLEQMVNRPVATLSGGEAQRVAIARALASRPRVLLLDEPLSALDHNTRLELQEQLKKLHRSLHLTTLHVTHSRDEASALGDHLAIMLGGKIVQQGTLSEVMARPFCPFVTQFLGLAPNPSVEPPACAAGCTSHANDCTLNKAGERHGA